MLMSCLSSTFGEAITLCSAGNSIFFSVKRIEDPIGLLPAKLIIGINKVCTSLTTPFSPGTISISSNACGGDADIGTDQLFMLLQRGVHFFRPVPKEYLHSAELRDIMQVIPQATLRPQIFYGTYFTGPLTGSAPSISRFA